MGRETNHVAKIERGVLGFALLTAATFSIAIGGDPEPLPATEFDNLSYRGIYDNPITLRNGVYEGQPFVPGGTSRPRVQLIDEVQAHGDLNGDGREETAVLLAESSGGSGVMSYLALVALRDGKLQNLDTVLLGDRVQIRSLRVEPGALVLEFIGAGSGDASCCPTRKTRISYQVQEGQLVEASREDQGPISLRDIEGVTWRLTQLGREAPVPKGVEVTMTVDGEKISGSAGCNRYFGTIREPARRELAIGPIGATRMACPEPGMGTEDRFLSALESVRQFGFLNGRLALTYRRGDAEDLDALVFAPSP